MLVACALGIQSRCTREPRPLSHVAVKDLGHLLGTLLGYPLLAALVIDIADAEPSLIPFGPLEVAARRSVSIIFGFPCTELTP